MRVFSENIKVILSAEDLAAFYLVKIEINGVTLYHTTLPYDVTVAGLGTFSSENNLVKIEAPRLTTVVDRSAYKLIYADPEFEFKSQFELGAIGSKVWVYIGFFNSTDSTLGDAEPGAPLLNPEDVLQVYSGIIDSHGYAVSEDGEVLATFECASPMADLNSKNFFITTNAELRKVDVTDTALEYVHETSTSVSLGWGKI